MSNGDMLVDITSTFKGVFCILFFLTKPYECYPTSPVYRAHESNLRSALIDILLINTDGIGPQAELSTRLEVLTVRLDMTKS